MLSEKHLSARATISYPLILLFLIVFLLGCSSGASGPVLPGPGGGAGEALVHYALTDKETRLRRYAAEALGRIGPGGQGGRPHHARGLAGRGRVRAIRRHRGSEENPAGRTTVGLCRTWNDGSGG